MKHADAIKQLMPLPLGLEDDANISIEGAFYDIVYAHIEQLQREFYPHSAELLLSVWEAEYGITPRADQSLADRRAAVIAQAQSDINLTKSWLIAAGRSLGYNFWDIVENGNTRPFLLGESRVGDRLYEARALWQVVIHTGVTNFPVELQNYFRDIMAPHLAVWFAP